MAKPELVDGGSRVVVKHKNPDYTPWTIAPVKPKGFRDAWSVLRGRYEPRVTLDRRLTMVGMDKALKRAFSDALAALNDESRLIFPVFKRPDADA